PEVVYSTKGFVGAGLRVHPNQGAHRGAPLQTVEATAAPGVLVYMRTPSDNDALAWIGEDGEHISTSQYQILKAAECAPKTPALQRRSDHHDLVRKAVEIVLKDEKSIGGQLGRPSGARFKAYTRLKRFSEEVKGTIFESAELLKAIDEIFRYPLRQSATDTLNRQLRIGVNDDQLALHVIALREDNKLCDVHDEEKAHEPRIICSLGLANG
ncbi:MAG: hypothetical protein M3447_07030, partial [Acidobacteriota bacterium]|nr:hypothetical protein [Acidobacteriota bacterium]